MSSTNPSAGTVVLSLVLCTLGTRRKQLERLFDSLEGQVLKGFEIILVDQNLPGHLDDMVQSRSERLALKHVRSNRGLSLARNVGMCHATGEIVGFPDDDCWYLPDTLMRVADCFQQNPRIGILLGRTIDQFGAPSLSPLRKQSGAVTKRNVWTSGNSNTLFVRRSAIPDHGGFDEGIGVGAPTRFQSGEETDFILNLMRHDACAVYISDLKICHEQVQRVGVAQELKRAWSYSLGFGYVLKKHNFGHAYLTYRLGRSLFRAGLAVIGLRPIYGLSRLVWGAGTLVGYVTAHPRG
jgi:glycosyltransferase involved in cell wall biosynthesis